MASTSTLHHHDFYTARKGVKRKRDEEEEEESGSEEEREEDDEEGEEGGMNVIRISPAEQRQRILDLSKQKLFAQNPENPVNHGHRREPCLLRSVLILRTLKGIEDELRNEGYTNEEEAAVDNIPDMSTTQMTLDRLRLPDMSSFMYPLASSPMPMSVDPSSSGDSGSYMGDHGSSVVNLTPVASSMLLDNGSDRILMNDNYNEHDSRSLLEFFSESFPYDPLSPDVVAEGLGEQAAAYEVSTYSASSTAVGYSVTGLMPGSSPSAFPQMMMDSQPSSVTMYGGVVAGSSSTVLTPLMDAQPVTTGVYTTLMPGTSQSVVMAGGLGHLTYGQDSHVHQMLVDFDRELSNFHLSSQNNYSSQYFLPQTAAIPSCSYSGVDTSYSCSPSSVVNSQLSSNCRGDSSGSDDLDSIMQVINSSRTVAV